MAPLMSVLKLQISKIVHVLIPLMNLYLQRIEEKKLKQTQGGWVGSPLV